MRDKLDTRQSDSGETRTHGQWLKRPLLYQLSYRVDKITLHYLRFKLQMIQ